MSMLTDEAKEFFVTPSGLSDNEEYLELKEEFYNYFGAVVTSLEDIAGRAVIAANSSGGFSLNEFRGEFNKVLGSQAWQGLTDLVPKLTSFGPLKIVGKGLDARDVVDNFVNKGWEDGVQSLGKLAFTSLATGLAIGITGALVAAVVAGTATSATAIATVSVISLAAIGIAAGVADLTSGWLYDEFFADAEKAAKGEEGDVVIRNSEGDSSFASSPTAVINIRGQTTINCAL